MKASELIKYLQDTIISTKFDPDVVADITGQGKFDIELGGMEGTASYDYPNQTSPHRTLSATVHLKIVDPNNKMSKNPYVDYCDCDIKLEMHDMQGYKCAHCGKFIDPAWKLNP